MDALTSLRAASRNEHGRWSFSDPAKDLDPTLAANRIHSGYFVPRITPKFKLPPTANVFTLGSCFAREIETALIKRGMTVSSRPKEIESQADFPTKAGVTTIYDLFNRYNVPSIVRELAHLSPSSNFDLGDQLIYEHADGLFDDLHYTAAVESAARSAVLQRRAWLREKLSTGYKQADVVIITLGLAEAWYDEGGGHYLNVISSPQMLRRYNDRFRVKLICYSEALQHLQEGLRFLQRDGKRVILTVSPVPLQVTFLQTDIVLANAAAKATLRALCEEVTRDTPDVDYFPSFEMVTYSDHKLAWKPDGRHVQFGMVERITNAAIQAYFADSRFK